MREYSAVSGCVDHELALFGEKFDLLSEVLTSSPGGPLKDAHPASSTRKPLGGRCGSEDCRRSS
jgi:hypothetical protein